MQNTIKILTLLLILATHCVSYSTGSLESQAKQLCLSRKVSVNVGRVCPEKQHKFDLPSNSWKGIAKLLARNSIRDLTRFEPDTATVDLYTNWVCSGEGGKHIFSFPSLNTMPHTSLNENVSTESEESNDQAEVAEFGLDGSSSSAYFDVKVNAISFILGCLIGALITYFSGRSAQPVTDLKKLRRPEL
jgi:hypothetical protein